MASERERFEEIAAKLRRDDVDFFNRTERLSRGVNPRRSLFYAVATLVAGLVSLLICAQVDQPILGAGVYLITTFGLERFVRGFLDQRYALPLRQG